MAIFFDYGGIMIVITENEILEYTKDMFTDDEKIIQGKHNVFKGEKDFALGIKEYGCGAVQITASDMGVLLYTDFGFEKNCNFMQIKIV